MFEVRFATSDLEQEDAFSVRRKVFVEEQGVPLNLELDHFDKTAAHFVVYSSESPIGAGRIREINDGIGKVERVCILAEYRGKHLGNLVMHALEEHAEKTDMNKIILNAQSYAVPFYEKLGYVITSPEFMDADIPHRAMEKVMARKA
ncbi:GNAT family N-acetyltransferase [Sporosarcina sp. E16_8]|uniref:GNAT family N-acetyltransferase n=1 Tax=Sporosarcina sp. E16_8 TaxID=2789295 RepID=UPI001A91839F|nr:GNAT family N-acetyltransferase [Sporosarcina sp. E16_8]MBO0585981.1 GNAT family N-acetyltransferase [Sporosarcina sp. E16_8]